MGEVVRFYSEYAGDFSCWDVFREDQIDKQVKTYHTINIHVALTNLANIGNVLKLAYAGSRGFSCSAPIIEILANYQSLIKNSFITASSFVEACLSALNYHRMAIMLADKNKIDKSILIVSKCSELAKKMAAESEKLIVESQNLCDLSTQALIKAHDDETVSITEKKRIEKLIHDSKERHIGLKSKTEHLNKQISEFKQTQERLQKQEDDARLKKQAGEAKASGILTNLFTSILEPVAKVAIDVFLPGLSVKNLEKVDSVVKTVLDKNDTVSSNKLNKRQDDIKNIKTEPFQHTKKESESSTQKSGGSNNQNINSEVSNLQSQQNEIMYLRLDLQKEEREVNAELASIGYRIRTLKKDDKDLTAAIASLELVITSLGKVKTTFEHTKQFWKGVQAQCESLANNSKFDVYKDIEELEEFKDAFIQDLKQSGLSWLALGKINFTAKEAFINILLSQRYTYDS